MKKVTAKKISSCNESDIVCLEASVASTCVCPCKCIWNCLPVSVCSVNKTSRPRQCRIRKDAKHVLHTGPYTCVHTDTYTLRRAHTEPLREIYMSAWHCSNPWCQSSSTWALLSAAGRQSPIYQAPSHSYTSWEVQREGVVALIARTVQDGLVEGIVSRCVLGVGGEGGGWWSKAAMVMERKIDDIKRGKRERERGTPGIRRSDKTLVVQILAVTMWGK